MQHLMTVLSFLRCLDQPSSRVSIRIKLLGGGFFGHFSPDEATVRSVQADDDSNSQIQLSTSALLVALSLFFFLL